jgi:hypothetical protein
MGSRTIILCQAISLSGLLVRGKPSLGLQVRPCPQIWNEAKPQRAEERQLFRWVEKLIKGLNKVWHLSGCAESHLSPYAHALIVLSTAYQQVGAPDLCSVGSRGLCGHLDVAR